MRVSAIQMDVQFADPECNYQQVQKLIEQATQEKPDVLVLPETWNVGFFPREDLQKVSDRDGERTREFLSALAARHNVNIVGGSVANQKHGKIYNSAYIFDRAGSCIAQYDKTHLFSYMKEDAYFEKGDRLAVFELDGIRCGIVICYDVRFPELVRTLALQGIAVLFVVAQWPVERVLHWRILNQARAIENQIFLAAVNSCGKLEETVCGGYSALFDPWGNILAGAEGKEKIISAELDLSIVTNIRDTINVYQDRRTNLYKL